MLEKTYTVTDIERFTGLGRRRLDAWIEAQLIPSPELRVGRRSHYSEATAEAAVARIMELLESELKIKALFGKQQVVPGGGLVP